MKIGGFQRFSLLDFPGQLAAIIFTQGCNFRCPYCHNPGLVDPKRYGTLIPEAEVLSFLASRQGKLNAVTITGGEPTLQKNLIPFVHKLRDMGYQVKLDTNGSNPRVIENLVQQELVDYWAMDVKAPLPLYQVITRSKAQPEDILRSMNLLRDSGREFEFRTTFFEALLNWNDLSLIQELLRPGDKFYLQQCCYTETLDGLRNTRKMDISLGDATYLHLMDHPSCQNLINWGNQNQVDIHIRSL